MNTYNGIINVYKEAGYTSFDVVAKLRGILKQKKIGHTGTLDPDATGVLPVVTGNATKLADYLTDKKKEYIAAFILGIRTDTCDISGTVISDSDMHVSDEDIRRATVSYTGDIMQIPPMYSALKVNGRKLCDLAREGREVERKPRPVTIYEAEILHIGSLTDSAEVFGKYYGKYDRQIPGNESCLAERTVVCMRVVCSKGTYIRTLCDDIGLKLGTGATLIRLKRTLSGVYGIDTAHTLSEIESMAASGDTDRFIIPTDTAFGEYPEVHLSGESLRLARNGNAIVLKGSGITGDNPGSEYIRVYDDKGVFFALYERKASGQGIYRPKTMFL